MARERSCKLIIDKKDVWRDNIFIERLWGTVRYEEINLHTDDSVAEAHRSIRRYLGWYNQARTHSKLHKMTPNEAYAVMLPTVALDKGAAKYLQISQKSNKLSSKTLKIDFMDNVLILRYKRPVFATPY